MRGLIDWRRTLIALPVLALAGLGAYVLLPRGSDASTPRAVLADTPASSGAKIGVRKGDVARDFIGQSPDGAAVRLSDLRGRPTIINFWATWCTSCLAELPDLKAVQRGIGADELNVVAVNAGEDSTAARRFLRTLDAPAFHVGMDPTLVVADAYGVFGLPESVFVDAGGVVRAVYTGQLSRELMEQYVRAASTGTDGPDAPTKVRLITTVARDHTLEVRRAPDGRAELRSKSLRCDESYCADAAIAAFERGAGVTAVERHLDDDPPRIVVAFARDVIDLDTLGSRLAEQLNAHADPLYERPLDVTHK